MNQGIPVSRRQFVKGAAAVGGVFIIAAGIAPKAGVMPAHAVSSSEASSSGGDVSRQYGFLVNVDKCQGCEKCVAACRRENHLSDVTADRRHVRQLDGKRGKGVYVSTSCMHCAKPNCERVCPAGAISKGDAGIVSVDSDRCIGCKYCFEACPYGMPSYNDVSMDKCDCCLGAGVAPGDTPYCVRACIFNALKFGPIDDLRAEYPNAVVVGAEGDPSCLINAERG